MNRQFALLLVLALLQGAALGVPPPVLAQVGSAPTIDRLFEQSPVYRDARARDGCAWIYNKAQRTVECSTKIAVVLARGAKQTTVNNADVRPYSRVRCGCFDEGLSKSVGCNEPGRWIGRVKVVSVANGSFVLGHSFAAGDEIVACELGG